MEYKKLSKEDGVVYAEFTEKRPLTEEELQRAQESYSEIILERDNLEDQLHLVETKIENFGGVFDENKEQVESEEFVEEEA